MPARRVESGAVAGGAVLVVEDERTLRRVLRAALEGDGHRVQEARTMADAERAITRARPDLILLDLGLPDGDGLELVARLRATSDAPVIILSGRDDDAVKIAALDAGVDDYVTKPFGVDVLLARVRVALRRARARGAAVEPILDVGSIHLDTERGDVSVEGRHVHLTPIELRLLAILARARGRVVTVETLLRELWPMDPREPYHLRVHMSTLRRKIERDPARPRWILTMIGFGYRLSDGATLDPH